MSKLPYTGAVGGPGGAGPGFGVTEPQSTTDFVQPEVIPTAWVSSHLLHRKEDRHPTAMGGGGGGMGNVRKLTVETRGARRGMSEETMAAGTYPSSRLKQCWLL